MRFSLAASPQSLINALFLLRFIAMLGEASTILLIHYGVGVALPLPALFAVIGLLGLWNGLCYWRLRRAWPATYAEAFVHLSIDIIALTLILLLTGGPTNPFASLYLLPIAIAAAGMPAGYAWSVTGLCSLSYALLMLQYLAGAHAGAGFHLHVIGMWVNFMLAAILTTVFVGLLAALARRRDQALAAAREKALRDEQIVAMGALAAGTAHELGTPLSTLTISVAELQRERSQDAELQRDLETMAEQLGHCRQRLQDLQAAAPDHDAAPVDAASLLQAAVERWRVLRPEFVIETDLPQQLSEFMLPNEPTLISTLIGLLNNAADASVETGRHEVSITGSRRGDDLAITIGDRGKGIGRQQGAQAGHRIFSTKADGLGVGLVLSHAVLDRLGGNLVLEPRPGGGTLARISLPLTSV